MSDCEIATGKFTLNDEVISHGVDCGYLWHDFRGWQEMLFGLLERIRWIIKEQV